MAYRTIEVDVTLDEFDTDELVEELQNRGHGADSQGLDEEPRELLTRIYEQRKMGHSYERDLDNLIWQVLGRIS